MGIVVNGLPIILRRPTQSWDIENLDAYYGDRVIGSACSFLAPVRERG